MAKKYKYLRRLKNKKGEYYYNTYGENGEIVQTGEGLTHSVRDKKTIIKAYINVLTELGGTVTFGESIIIH